MAGAMKRLVPLLALLAASCGERYNTSVANPAYTGAAPRVLIDQGHHNRHTVRGTYRPFAELLRHDGYEVDVLDKTVSAARLAQVRIFVIPSALGRDEQNTTPAFTAAEAEAVQAWVRGGGSLLLITDHFPFGHAVRDLAAKFGVEMSGGMTFDPVHHDAGDDSRLLFTRVGGLLGAHPIRDGRGAAERVDRVMTFTGQSVRAARGTALLRLSDTAVHRAAHPRVVREGSTTRVNVEFGPPTPARGWAQAVALPWQRAGGRLGRGGDGHRAGRRRPAHRLQCTGHGQPAVSTEHDALVVARAVGASHSPGISSSLPVVWRLSRSRCASAALERGSSRSILTFSRPAATCSKISPARHSSSSRVRV